MNIGSLAINNMLVLNTGAGPASSKPTATRDSWQSTTATLDNPANTNYPETITADNILANGQDEPINRPPQDFQHTLSKKTMAESPQKDQANTEPKEQALQPSVVQNWLAGYPLAEHGEKGLVRVMEPKAGRELAQLLADLKAGEFSPVGAQAARSDKIKFLLTTDKGQSRLKSSKWVLAADAQSGEGGNLNNTTVSNNAVVGAKISTPRGTGEELVAEVLPNGSQTATSGPKSTIAEASAASNGQNPSLLNGKEVLTGGKTATASEKLAIAGKPAASDGQKTPVLDDSFPAVQDKSSELQSRLAGIGLGKSALIAEKPTDNKAETGQQWSTNAPGLSELLHGNSKEQQNNLSGDFIYQKLNPAQLQGFPNATKHTRGLLQISTNQPKDHNGSTSNNNSNLYFKQIFSHNNAPPFIAEQSSAFSPTASTAGNTSPSNVSESISRQVQDSIYSVLQRGDQQITIRLNPPELGKVSIKFQEQEDQIIGLLEVSKMQTKYEIEQALPQIIRNLADSGVQVKQLEVVLSDTNQSEQQSFKDQSLAAGQDGSFQQQDSTEGNNPNNKSDNEWPTNTDSYVGFSEPQEVLVSDDSINMLV